MAGSLAFGASSGARRWPRRCAPRPGPYGPLGHPTATGCGCRAASAPGSWPSAGRRSAAPATVARLPRRRRHVSDSRRRLDPGLELRGARRRRRRRGRHPLRPARADPGGLPDPRRHERQLLRGAHAVGHLALVRGGGRGARVGVRPARAQARRGPARARRVQARGRGGGPARAAGYLTEDLGDGGLYRFTPTSLAEPRGGRLEVAERAAGGCGALARRARPGGAHGADASAGRRHTPFARGEGIWFDSGTSTWPRRRTTASTRTTRAAGVSRCSTTPQARRTRRSPASTT